MLNESDLVKIIRATAECMLNNIKNDVIGTHKIREVSTLFGLIGSVKKDGKYMIVGGVFGSLHEHLRRLPPDWKGFDAETRKGIRQTVRKVAERMVKVAGSIEKHSDDLLKNLGDFELAIDELHYKVEEISRLLPKPPSLE